MRISVVAANRKNDGYYLLFSLDLETVYLDNFRVKKSKIVFGSLCSRLIERGGFFPEFHRKMFYINRGPGFVTLVLRRVIFFITNYLRIRYLSISIKKLK